MSILAGKTVLFAEDDGTMQFFVSSILKQELKCRDLIMCKDGRETLDELKSRKDPLDLILCDWEMPGATGDTILQYVRQSGRFNSVPFIMTTSRSDDESLQKVVRLGINHYLVKPFSAQDLIARIEKVLGDNPKTKKKVISRNNSCPTEISFDGGMQSYKGNLNELIDSKCIVKVPYFAHGSFGRPYDKVGLNIQVKDQTISIKAEIQVIGIDPDDPDHKNHVRVGFKVLDSEGGQLNKLISLLG
jgi:CheY-like chemotaxis protein